MIGHMIGMPASAAEVRELRGWIEATSASTKEIAESRIWRALTWLGSVIVSLSHKGPPAETVVRDDQPDYQRWIADFEASDVPPDQSRFPFRPEIGVVPAFSAHAPQLPDRTAASIRAQSYPARELYAGGQLPAGEYIAVVEAGSLLARDALLYVAGALQSEPRADIVYADEDSIDASGRRRDPFFKQDWLGRKWARSGRGSCSRMGASSTPESRSAFAAIPGTSLKAWTAGSRITSAWTARFATSARSRARA